uniref:Uncharacterized protein n=1 Tax=Arundo donax TaxID=35708 RepID=A0A0A9DPR3_ARUDO
MLNKRNFEYLGHNHVLKMQLIKEIKEVALQTYIAECSEHKCKMILYQKSMEHCHASMSQARY